MSFELQENAASCGTASLRYALSLLGLGLVRGEELDEAALRAVMGKSKWRQLHHGTHEDEIRAAAQFLGLEVAFHHHRASDPRGCFADLRTAAANGHPCLVTFHDDDSLHFHWVCVGGFDGSDVLVFDPALLDCGNVPAVLFDPVDPDGEHAPARMSVRRFEEWITPSTPVPDGDDHHFFLELLPAEDHADRFVPGGVTGALLDEMRDDDELYRNYDEHMDDLRTMFGVPSQVPDGQTAHDFLRQNRDRLLEAAEAWTLPAQSTFFEREFRSLLALTKAYYGFRVAPGDEAGVLARVGFYLGWRACEHAYEVGRYG